MNIEDLKIRSQSIRLVVFDLDGTLLKSDHSISESSLQAIRYLQSKGVKIAIASGRIYSMLGVYQYLIKDLDYIISVNGGAIDEIRSGVTLQKMCLSNQTVNHVIEYCLNHQLDCCLLSRGPSFFVKDSVRVTRFHQYNQMASDLGLSKIDLKYYDQKIEDLDNIEKILIQEFDEAKATNTMNYIQRFQDLTLTNSDKNLIDLCPKNVSKGNALVQLAKYMNIEPSQICAFGDYDNDVSMFEIAGISIAMSNASEKALDAADYITKSNDDDGIAYAISLLYDEKF